MLQMRNVLSAATLSAFIGSPAAPVFAAEFVTNGTFQDVSGNTSSNFFLADGAGDLTGWTRSSK